MAEQFQNFFVTKLREACDAVATTIYVETVPSITEGTLVLEYANSTKHEIIHFTGVSGYGLTGCTRGLEGTTAQSHSAGTDVRQNLTAGMIDKIINGVITTENIANSAVTTAKINNGAVTADKIDFTTLNVIIDTNPSYTAFFGYSTYSKKFTVPKTGYYIIHDSWCGVFKRINNSINTLDVKIDNTRVAQYIYASVGNDDQWGATRRTITGQDILVRLTAGEHTLSVSGNLYYDEDYYPKHHYISAEFFCND